MYYGTRLVKLNSLIKNIAQDENVFPSIDIKKSVPIDIKFGDAKISEKHCNFFVNSNNATFKDMKSLVEFVQKEVKSKTGIEIETEIEIIN